MIEGDFFSFYVDINEGICIRTIHCYRMKKANTGDMHRNFDNNKIQKVFLRQFICFKS